MPNKEAVTFVIMCYNQEKYIRAAVEGAFSQCHQPLHIVISDDRSTDRTFEIANELVVNYSGAHKVTLRQNASNLGLINHVNALLEIVDTELLVISAGDDISMPHRTARLLDVFVKKGRPALIHSKALIIDGEGELTGETAPLANLWRDIEPLAAFDSSSLYLGATGAWNRELFRKYGPIENTDTYEDLVCGFRASLERSAIFLNEALVYYRVASGSIISNAEDGDKFLKLMEATLQQRRVDLTRSTLENRRLLGAALEKKIIQYQIKRALRRSWSDLLLIALRHPLAFARAAWAGGLHRLGRASSSIKGRN